MRASLEPTTDQAEPIHCTSSGCTKSETTQFVSTEQKTQRELWSCSFCGAVHNTLVVSVASASGPID